jgi:hypothetical protein
LALGFSYDARNKILATKLVARWELEVAFAQTAWPEPSFPDAKKGARNQTAPGASGAENKPFAAKSIIVTICFQSPCNQPERGEHSHEGTEESALE